MMMNSSVRSPAEPNAPEWPPPPTPERKVSLFGGACGRRSAEKVRKMNPIHGLGNSSRNFPLEAPTSGWRRISHTSDPTHVLAGSLATTPTLNSSDSRQVAN